jgi:hypothetical protein
MSKFIEKYENLRKESVEYISNFLKNNGGSFEFISQEEVESEEFYEIAYELPQATYVGKMEYTDYYAITSIRFEKDNIWLNGVNLGNDNDDYTFGVYEVDVACLCDCADNLIVKQ